MLDCGVTRFSGGAATAGLLGNRRDEQWLFTRFQADCWTSAGRLRAAAADADATAGPSLDAEPAAQRRCTQPE
jgi:hypothetical protein